MRAADDPNLCNSTGVQAPHSLGDEGVADRGAGEERLGPAHAPGFACGEDNADPALAGGVTGGIATGEPIVLRAAFKPTSSVAALGISGRHDPCVGLRGAPVVEAMVALVLADHKLLHRAQCGERRAQ